MSNAIRLTNKTAIALRKNAVRMRTMYGIIAAVFSVMMAALAVYWGLKWLPAVPLMVVGCVVIDVLIVLHARSVYLSLIGQAICTEAAAREIRSGMSESQRREKAITDLINVKADAQSARQKQKTSVRSATSFFESEKNEKEDMDEEDSVKNNTVQRRRRQSDGLKLIKGEQIK